VHTQLTSGSASIPSNVIGAGFASCLKEYVTQATFNKLQLPREISEKETSKSSQQHSGAVSHAQTEMEIRHTSDTSAHLCYLPNSAHAAHLRFNLYSFKCYWYSR
jgi:organic hydroperoxide reductase OsmC/OhrA